MRIYLLSAALLTSGCALTPRLAQPASPVSAVFPGGSVTAAGENHAANLGWRTMFDDPRLQRVLEIALERNRDLRLAALNVEAAQAQFRVQRAAQLPSIEAAGSLTRQRTAASPETGSGATAAVQTQYAANVGVAAFELDLFGRARASSHAAFARYLASEQGRRAVQIAFVGAVADAFFAERLAQGQLDLAQRTLADWQESLELARRLKTANQNSGLEVAQAEGQVASAQADWEARARALARAHNALVLLVGTELPADLPPARPLDEPPSMPQLPAGLPSELLTRRPDILQAEQNLVAANADIGVARAAFFPRISLTSSLGYASGDLGSLFADSHRIWTFSPQVTQPLFQGGRLRAELRLAKLRKLAAVVEYERAIQIAFREVADGLAGSPTYHRQIAAQTQAVASARTRLALSTLRYRAGVDGRLELLDAQRQLYATQQALLDLRREEIGNAIALYKALGGGLLDSHRS